MAFPEKTQKNLNSVRSKLFRYKVLLPLVLNIHENKQSSNFELSVLQNSKEIKIFWWKKTLDVNTFKTLNSFSPSKYGF